MSLATARDENVITNDVFFARHPELPRVPLRKDQTALVREWLRIRDQVVRPKLAQAGSADVSSPRVPLGTLECNVPGRKPFRYAFTADDVDTTARFLISEAGGRDNAENRGTLWALLNRYAFLRDRTPGWGTFGNFLKQYSQTLQPYIKHYASVKEFVAKCNPTFDNDGCLFRPTHTEKYPGTNVPMGQLTTFLETQNKPWSELGETARRLALRTLTGAIPNPVGNASDVDDTKVYFRREHGRQPTRAEWEQYTRALAARKKAAWRPEQVGYDQFGHNVLFVTPAAVRFPEGVTRIVPPGAAPGAPGPIATAGAAAPVPAPAPAPTATATATPTPAGPVIYDGSTPAPGTVERRRSFPCSPPLRNDSSSRSAATYDNVINQFAVGVNPRYAHRGRSTYCNIFAWDVTSAMGAEIPHWVSSTGDRTPHLKGHELNANALNDWLNRYGARFGWRKVPLAEAVAAANRGCPAVASWKKPGGIGHIAVIRPGVATASEGPWMAQAGARNENFIRMYTVWRKSANVEPWIHA